MARAEGIHFWDSNEKRYTDINSQLMCTNIGHQHPKVIQAMKDQMDDLCYAAPGMATKVRAEFGPLLAKRTPGDLNKFFFTLGGAESNENALKLARFYTGRTKVITRHRSYHGGTLACMSMTGDHRRWASEDSSNGGMSGVIRVFDPYKYRSLMYRDGMSDEEYSDIMVKQLEETILYENPDSIACMFLETVTGSNGIIPPPKGYLKGVRELLTKYGIMMVCDEVMAGVGRTGAWFACDHYDVVPDIMTMAKGITSAFAPLGVVAMKPEIAAAFDDKPFYGGLTYSGHPLCLSAGVATLKVIEEEGIVDNSRIVGYHLATILENMMANHKCVGDVRSIGLFGVLELVSSRKNKTPMCADTMAKVSRYLRKNGIYAYCNGHLFLINPPLIITKEQLDEAFVIIDAALSIADGDCEIE